MAQLKSGTTIGGAVAITKGAYGVGNYGQTLANTKNLNEVNESGLYIIGNASTTYNAPGTGSAYLVVQSYNSSNIIQTFILVGSFTTATATNSIYKREYYNGAWGTWTRQAVINDNVSRSNAVEPSTQAGYPLNKKNIATRGTSSSYASLNNTNLTSGFYTSTNGLPNANGSQQYAGYWNIIVFTYEAAGNYYQSQIAIRADSNSAGTFPMYRNQNSNGIWSDWLPMGGIPVYSGNDPATVTTGMLWIRSDL